MGQFFLLRGARKIPQSILLDEFWKVEKISHNCPKICASLKSGISHQERLDRTFPRFHCVACQAAVEPFELSCQVLRIFDDLLCCGPKM